MRRSLWKSFFCDPKLFRRVFFVIKNNLQKKIIVNVWSRSSTILPYFSGLTFRVHNGKKFAYVTVKPEMFYYKFGEFSYTKRMGRSIHLANLKKPLRAQKNIIKKK